MIRIALGCLFLLSFGTLNALAVTTSEDAAGGCDGIKNGFWGFHVASNQRDPWWQVDLGQSVELDRVVVYNRTDGNCASRTSKVQILVANDASGKEFTLAYQHNGTTFHGIKEKKPLVVELASKSVTARYVRLQIRGNCSLALDEIEVFAKSDPERNIALGKPADQISISPYSAAGPVKDYAVLRGNSKTSPAATQTVAKVDGSAKGLLEKAHKLAKRLTTADSKQLRALAAELKQLEGQLGKSDDASFREQVASLSRKIAFTNPKLAKIDKLLFIKRHDAGGPYHMCDQYYGCNAKAGGGLFVLNDPFGENPKLVNLLENSVVENGRLAGKKLDSGSFLSPEVSFDGKTIVFAYSECKATKTYTWPIDGCYHIFKVNADGSHLVQLTDGAYDDFDPCFLPDGRIVFITTRRGGYLRCGRHCPVYTTYSMKADGSDIYCLSYHETHEWQPSVDNDGMLVYTRWDYIDRDTNIAHHLWTSFPDGRDPRSNHGNYPVRRESRPWMEMSIRAIPGSHKYVATAAAHHGHAFGSLVLIDPRIVDDNAMSQLECLTPEVPFPEAGGKGAIRQHQQFATAWPFDEQDYLVSYDPGARNHGIYWIDRDGNRQLVYRDPSIACLSPIPLAARRRPPVIPDRTQGLAASKTPEKPLPSGTISVSNVYDADFPWPENTVISSLRVIQVLPKTTAPPNQPRIGVANQTNARAVLGTVPVEKDGSVHFTAPAGKVLYFQAIDEKGMAVQSMRSGTYLHAGEQMTCHGCHETKQRAPVALKATPLAMSRKPSSITPDVSGSNPMNYVRLVQPVLDRNCVKCHQEKKALDLTGVADGSHGWTRSYKNLSAKYGFYFNVSNGSIRDGVHGGSRSTAGKFGARAAKLLNYLDEKHHGVKLSDEDFHRVTLWLDSNSPFYGSYENTPAQARGEVVQPILD